MKHRSQNTFARDPDGQVIGLNLRSNDLTDGNLAFLSELPHLRALNLSENKITHLSIPAIMKVLRFLDLNENPALRSVAAKKCPRLFTPSQNGAGRQWRSRQNFHQNQAVGQNRAVAAKT